LRLYNLCRQLRQLALDLDFGLPPMVLSPPFAAAFALPDMVGPQADMLFLVAHPSTPFEARTRSFRASRVVALTRRIMLAEASG
jgi:hypothetical protein